MSQPEIDIETDGSDVRAQLSSLEGCSGSRAVTGSMETEGSVSNDMYQLQLAALLRDTMEMDDAIQFCLEHGWDQTLRTILTENSRIQSTMEE